MKKLRKVNFGEMISPAAKLIENYKWQTHKLIKLFIRTTIFEHIEAEHKAYEIIHLCLNPYLRLYSLNIIQAKKINFH